MLGRVLRIWRFEGTIDRGAYAMWGFLLMAIKYNLDRLVAALHGHAWSPLNYLRSPTDLDVLAAGNRSLIWQLLLLAIPFIWAGLALTVQRLRSVGLPLKMVVLFFVPTINLLFLAVLCILPARLRTDLETGPPDNGFLKAVLDRIIPRSRLGSAAMAVVLTGAVGIGLIAISVHGFRQYGAMLFVGLPFALGLMASLLYGYHQERNVGECFAVAGLAIVLVGLSLLAFAIEGVICILMAAPIGGALACLGALVGCSIQKMGRGPSGGTTALPLMILLLPGLMGAEALAPPTPPVYAVRTLVEIDAPPTDVWRHVVVFSELPPPKELIFRLGVAHPLRAEISGRGVGAVRKCVFSTGPFIEPITVWDEPHLLKFDVTAQPPAMTEMSPYSNINAPHLDSFLVSQGGQFALTELPGNRTRLEGTTWYHHNIWPAAYWRIWSDGIIHDIHNRVLAHIKAETERETRMSLAIPPLREADPSQSHLN